MSKFFPNYAISTTFYVYREPKHGLKYQYVVMSNYLVNANSLILLAYQPLIMGCEEQVIQDAVDVN